MLNSISGHCVSKPDVTRLMATTLVYIAATAMVAARKTSVQTTPYKPAAAV